MKYKYDKNSLVFRTGIIITLILTLQITLLLANNIYLFNVTTQNTVNAQKSAMAVSIEQVRNNLKYATSVLNELSINYIKNVNDYSNKSELKRYLASIDMAAMLETKISSNDVLECVFFSSPANDIYLTRFHSLISWDQKLGIDDYIKDNHQFDNDAIDETWHLIKIGTTNYLMQVYSLNYVNVGVLIKVSRFVQAIERASNFDNTQYVFTDSGGNVLAGGSYSIVNSDARLENDNEIIPKFEKDYFIITMPVMETPLRLSCIMNRVDIFYGIDIIQLMIILFGLLAVIAVIGSLLFLKKQVVGPVKKLAAATKEVESGNFDYRITEEITSSEFRALMRSFNNMVREIKSLKILSYEEKIEKQRAELKYLQMQIRPHFYLNAINTISSLSLQNKNKDIRKFIMALSNYLRYLFSDNLALVTVRSEIEHAVDYIKLQQIKYPHKIFYMVEVKDECAGYKLPKLLVQTFIENIFKHAFNGEEMLSIFIKAEFVEIERQRFARILIEDNGDGFDDKFLAGQTIPNESIGINNIRRTIALTYGREDLITLSNTEEGGARVMVLIPEIRVKGEKE